MARYDEWIGITLLSEQHTAPSPRLRLTNTANTRLPTLAYQHSAAFLGGCVVLHAHNPQGWQQVCSRQCGRVRKGADKMGGRGKEPGRTAHCREPSLISQLFSRCIRKLATDVAKVLMVYLLLSSSVSILSMLHADRTLQKKGRLNV